MADKLEARCSVTDVPLKTRIAKLVDRHVPSVMQLLVCSRVLMQLLMCNAAAHVSAGANAKSQHGDAEF